MSPVRQSLIQPVGRVHDLVGPDLEARERVRAEGVADRHVGGIAAARDAAPGRCAGRCCAASKVCQRPPT